MSFDIAQMISVYENMFKLVSENQKNVSNLQLEILSRTQYTSYPHHIEIFNSQITSNIEQMDGILSQQTKILDKLNEMSTYLMNNRRTAFSSNVYIIGTHQRDQQQQQEQQEQQQQQHQEGEENSQQQPQDEPLIDISINILDNQPQINNSLVDTTTFGLIETPLNVSCPITYETFQHNSQVSRIVNCGHIFNTTALNRWLTINQTCPTCRSRLGNEEASGRRRRRRMTTSTNGSRIRDNIENVLSELTDSMLSRFLPIDLSQNVFSREEML
jgi:hypothetical protein